MAKLFYQKYLLTAQIKIEIKDILQTVLITYVTSNQYGTF